MPVESATFANLKKRTGFHMDTAAEPAAIELHMDTTAAEPAAIELHMDTAKLKVEPVTRAATEVSILVSQDTEAQLRLQTDKRWRQITVVVLLSFAFVDTLGTVLFLPAGGILCQLAEGGPMEGYALLMRMPNTTDFEAIGASQSFIDLFDETDEEYRLTAPIDNLTYYVWENLGMPKAFKSNPAKFSTAMNLLNVNGAISGAIGSAFWGWFSDRFGRKIGILICHVGGAAGYVLMYVSGVHLNSYWGYFFGLMLNGLFSGACAPPNGARTVPHRFTRAL